MPTHNPAIYPMRLVSELTGLRSDTIRAWERRYNAIQPQRTAGNTRKFSDDDVRRLTLLRQLTDFGLSIGTVAALDMRQLEQLVERVVSGHSGRAEGMGTVAPSSEEVIRSFLDSLARFDTQAASAGLRAALTRLGASRFVHAVVIPLVQALHGPEGDEALTTAQRNVAQRQLQTLLSGLFPPREDAQASTRMLLVAPPGHDVELAMGVCGILAQLHSIQVLNLGGGLPWQEVEGVAEDIQPEVMVVSLRGALGAASRDALRDLVHSLKGRVGVWVFSHGGLVPALDHAMLIGAYDEFDAALSTLAPAPRDRQSVSSSSLA